MVGMTQDERPGILKPLSKPTSFGPVVAWSYRPSRCSKNVHIVHTSPGLNGYLERVQLLTVGHKSMMKLKSTWMAVSKSSLTRL